MEKSVHSHEISGVYYKEKVIKESERKDKSFVTGRQLV